MGQAGVWAEIPSKVPWGRQRRLTGGGEGPREGLETEASGIPLHLLGLGTTVAGGSSGGG